MPRKRDLKVVRASIGEMHLLAREYRAAARSPKQGATEIVTKGISLENLMMRADVLRAHLGMKARLQ